MSSDRCQSVPGDRSMSRHSVSSSTTPALSEALSSDTDAAVQVPLPESPRASSRGRLLASRSLAKVAYPAECSWLVLVPQTHRPTHLRAPSTDPPPDKGSECTRTEYIGYGILPTPPAGAAERQPSPPKEAERQTTPPAKTELQTSHQTEAEWGPPPEAQPVPKPRQLSFPERVRAMEADYDACCARFAAGGPWFPMADFQTMTVSKATPMVPAGAPFGMDGADADPSSAQGPAERTSQDRTPTSNGSLKKPKRVWKRNRGRSQARKEQGAAKQESKPEPESTS